MLTGTGARVNTDGAIGYRPGSLERLVRQWAVRYWPDARDEWTWRKYQAYFYRQYLAQMRWETAQGRKG